MDLMLLKCVAYMLLRAYANEKYLVKNIKRARYSLMNFRGGKKIHLSTIHPIYLKINPSNPSITKKYF